MKNGIHFRSADLANALVLVEDAGEGEGNSADYLHSPEENSDPASLGGLQPPSAVVILASVSVACAVTALVTGSYAAWLTRQRIARQALTDVNDILKSCQARMQQLEADVQRLPRF